MAYSANHDNIAYFAGTAEEGEKLIIRMKNEQNEAAMLNRFYDLSMGFNKYDRGFPDAAKLQNQIPGRKFMDN